MFTCVGAQTAIRKKYRAPIILWSALINACGGGMVRDVVGSNSELGRIFI